MLHASPQDEFANPQPADSVAATNPIVPIASSIPFEILSFGYAFTITYAVVTYYKLIYLAEVPVFCFLPKYFVGTTSFRM